MHQRTDEVSQKLVAWLMVVGIVLICGSAVMIVAMPAPLFIVIFLLLMVLGIGLIVMAVVYGIAYEKGTRRGPARVEPNCRVMARYGTNRDHEVVSADWATDDPEDFKPFVRMYSPTKGAMELECAMPVWEQCGEGLLGDAVIQGRWLTSFTPKIGAPQSPTR